jgi:hypothetical protein
MNLIDVIIFLQQTHTFSQYSLLTNGNKKTPLSNELVMNLTYYEKIDKLIFRIISLRISVRTVG